MAKLASFVLVKYTAQSAFIFGDERTKHLKHLKKFTLATRGKEQMSKNAPFGRIIFDRMKILEGLTSYFLKKQYCICFNQQPIICTAKQWCKGWGQKKIRIFVFVLNTSWAQYRPIMWCHKLLRFSACSIRYWEMGIGCVLTTKKNGNEGTTDEQKNNDAHINQLYDSQIRQEGIWKNR